MIDAASAAGCQQGSLGFENVDIAGFHLQRNHAQHIAVGIANQVECHPLHQKLRMRREVLLVQGVQHGVAGTIGRGTGALHGFFAVVGGVPAKWALVDGAVGVAVKRHAEMFHFVHHFGRLAAHELDGVLVAQPVGAFDGVVEVPFPMVFAHIAERRAHAALRGHRVRTGRKHLGQHGDLQAGARQLQRGAHARAARAHDHHVEFAPRQVLHHCCHLLTVSTEPATPSRNKPPARQLRLHAG